VVAACLDEIAAELPGCILPAVFERLPPARLARQPQRRRDRFAEILAQAASLSLAHHIDRASDRVRGDRKSARHGFQHDEAKGVGPARENEAVGAGEERGQLLAELVAEEVDRRVARFEILERGSATDDELAAGRLGTAEVLDALLDRHAT